MGQHVQDIFALYQTFVTYFSSATLVMGDIMS